MIQLLELKKKFILKYATLMQPEHKAVQEFRVDLDSLISLNKNQKEAEMLNYTEWVGENYVRLHKCWVHRYQDQRDSNNWKSSEELLRIFNELPVKLFL